MNGKALIALAIAWAVTSPPAQAQAPVTRIVVPFAAGGGQDVLARILSTELAKELNTSVIVENRAGAGGSIGTSFVARAKPDGLTLLMAASSHTINAVIDPTTPYDPINDFAFVAHVGTGGYLFFVNSKLPVNTVRTFMEYARQNPGMINYASAGVGSATHLASAYFANQAKLNMVHVPFKSTVEAANSIIGGDTQMLIVPTLGSQAFIENPAIRLLAVVSTARIPTLPEVQTVSENGLPGFEFTSWFGLLGPAGMPADVTARINAASNKAIARSNAVIVQQGITPRIMSSADFSGLVTAHFGLMRQIIHEAGMAAAR